MVTRGLLAVPRVIVDDFDHFIRFFVMIQFGRTEAQAAKIRAFYALTTELAGLSEDHPDFLEMKNRKDSEFSRDGVYFALESRNMIEDLKVTYIFNTTGIKFIKSDIDRRLCRLQ